MNIRKEKLKFGMLEDIEYPAEKLNFISFGLYLNICVILLIV